MLSRVTKWQRISWNFMEWRDAGSITTQAKSVKICIIPPLLQTNGGILILEILPLLGAFDAGIDKELTQAYVS